LNYCGFIVVLVRGGATHMGDGDSLLPDGILQLFFPLKQI